MTGPRVLGLDLSLTATGAADSDGHTELIRTKPDPGQPLHARLETIAARVAQLAVSPVSAALVVVEGPSYGSKGNALHQLAGLWWMATHWLWSQRIPYAVVSPQVRARYATGRGNAGKDEVLAAAIRRWPTAAILDNNTADAWVLMAMGRDRLGYPLAELPAAHRAALDKVEWPRLAEAVAR